MRFHRHRPPVATPLSLLDAAYEARLGALERIRAASAAVHASRARLEASRHSWAASVERHERDAREALAAADEVKARSAAARCVPIDADIKAADEQLARFRDTEHDLAVARDVVAEQLDALRRRREASRGVRTTEAALDAVRAELVALDQGFEGVQRAIEQQS